ncbi:MAG: hypothetical protein ABIY51_10640 [Ferruginibacter sp.]
MKRICISACLIFINMFCIFSIANAQQPLPCGKYLIDFSAQDIANNFRRINTNQPGTVNYLVRVYFHILQNDDGTNAAITPAQVATEFTTLLSNYAADNLCFINAGTDNINNTFLNTLFNADNDPSGSFFAPYQVPRCINVFYTRKINGNNSACSPPCGYGGIALGGIPGTFCLVATGNIGPGATISHEVGHCLGLLHCFETANGYENINGSNSSTAADQVTDTPADPFAYNGSTCYTTPANSCTYVGTCADPNGATAFNPPYTNLMSYWGVRSGCYPTVANTNGQFLRVNSFLGSSTPLINCSSPSILTVFNTTVSSGFYMQSAINSLTTSGNVILNGTVKALVGGGIINLEPGFRASPTSGQIRIEVKPCN